jgi:regulator of sigma E protease
VLTTLAAFVFVLGVLIFVHELGHFLAAKAVGIGVPRFSIGFGPATPLRFKRGETEYVVAWIPIGGYVKMASREEQEAMAALEGGPAAEEYPEDKLFESKPLWARIMVISAGVVMNFLFAWVTYSAVAAVYGQAEDATATIGRIDAAALPLSGEPLAEVPRFTQILRVNGDTVKSWQAITAAITDPGSDRVRFDFAGEVDPVILPIRGTKVRDRVAVANAIMPAWEPVIGGVSPGTPADQAGLQPGDRVLTVDGDTVYVWHDIAPLVEPRAGDSLWVGLLRGEQRLLVSVVPVENSLRDLDGGVRKAGQLGVTFQPPELLRVRYGPLEAVLVGAADTWGMTELVLFTLKGIVLGQISAREVGGPVFIGQMSGEVARAGFVALLLFMALLSVNLAVLNLLPIPVLDGGHLVFLAIEGIRGKPLALDTRLRLTQLGVVVIMLLLVFVFTNDILRLLR